MGVGQEEAQKAARLSECAREEALGADGSSEVAVLLAQSSRAVAERAQQPKQLVQQQHAWATEGSHGACDMLAPVYRPLLARKYAGSNHRSLDEGVQLQQQSGL